MGICYNQVKYLSDEAAKRFGRACALSVSHLWDMPQSLQVILNTTEDSDLARDLAVYAWLKLEKSDPGTALSAESAAWALYVGTTPAPCAARFVIGEDVPYGIRSNPLTYQTAAFVAAHVAESAAGCVAAFEAVGHGYGESWSFAWSEAFGPAARAVVAQQRRFLKTLKKEASK